MDFAKRVLRFDVERTSATTQDDATATALAEGLKYPPVVKPHDDDELAGDEFEREYLFGAPRMENDDEVDALLNDADWLGLRGGAGPRCAMWVLVSLNAATLAVSGALLYWFVREVAVFQDSMYDLSLLGTILMGSVALVALTATIAHFMKGFLLVELSHWANLLLMPLLVLFELCMIFLWTDSTHYNDDGDEVKSFGRVLLLSLVGAQIALQVLTMVGNLAVPYDDTRKHTTFRGTLFTSCVILLLGATAVTVFAGLTLEEYTLLITEIDGWSVWTAAACGLLLAVLSICGLACTRKSLTAMLLLLPLFCFPLVAAAIVNYYLSYEVPTSDSTTGTSSNLLYSSIVAISIMPHAALALGTTLMWRRRIKNKHGYP